MASGASLGVLASTDAASPRRHAPALHLVGQSRPRQAHARRDRPLQEEGRRRSRSIRRPTPGTTTGRSSPPRRPAATSPTSSRWTTATSSSGPAAASSPTSTPHPRQRAAHGELRQEPARQRQGRRQALRHLDGRQLGRPRLQRDEVQGARGRRFPTPTKWTYADYAQDRQGRAGQAARQGLYFTANRGDVEAALEMFMRQPRQGALHRRRHSSPTTSATSPTTGTIWKQMQDDGVTPPPDVQALDASGALEKTMLITGNADHSTTPTPTSSSPCQKLSQGRARPRRCFPNSETGKPGPVLQAVDVHLDVGEHRPTPEEAAKFLNFMITDLDCHRHPADRARRQRRLQGARAPQAQAERRSSRRCSTYLQLLGTACRSAAAAAAEGRRRNPERDSQQLPVDRVRQDHGRRRVARPSRKGQGDPAARLTRNDGQRHGRGHRRKRSGEAARPRRRRAAGLRRALQAQRPRLSVPAALADRLLRPDARSRRPPRSICPSPTTIS